MNSMTGYGRATAALGAHHVTVQLSSVNRRTLDLSVKLPDAWESLEPGVLEAVRRSVLRGKVHLAIEVSGGGTGPAWDAEAVGETLEQLAELAEGRGLRFEPTTELLWQIASAQRSGSAVPPPGAAGPTVLRAVQEALRALAAMRAKEGEALLIDFLRRLERLHAHVEAVAARAPQTVAGYREALLQRLGAAGLTLELGDERVLKEVALFADRCDVTEEITRLRSHLGQLRELLRAEGEIGRKAEFILQEIGREIHTVGSKANDIQVSQRVIEFKNELERVREQMANVE